MSQLFLRGGLQRPRPRLRSARKWCAKRPRAGSSNASASSAAGAALPGLRLYWQSLDVWSPRISSNLGAARVYRVAPRRTARLRGGGHTYARTQAWRRDAVWAVPLPTARLLISVLLLVAAPVAAQVAGGVVQDVSPAPLQLATLTQANLANACFASSPFGASSELSFSALQLEVPPSVAKLNVRALFTGLISCR